MKKTKIVCTIGPACTSVDILKKMILAGMNVARFNFSHGEHADHKKMMDAVKEARAELGLPVAIMLDTKGPEYRIGRFRDGGITLNTGDRFTFTTDEILGDEHRVSVSYKNLPAELEEGAVILLANGLLEFHVTAIHGNDIETEIVNGGELTDRKSMSFPGRVLKQVFLSEQDKSDLLFGIENDVDFVALSFVSDNIVEIIDAGDGIMVARGDMGVEIPFEQLPAIQKMMITTCRFRGKRVITATEMLESMIHNPRPTRAEISDVANAVYDGTSAVMLSGETAMGKYPVEAVAAMAKIAEQTEHSINYTELFHTAKFKIKNQIDAISHAACSLAIDIDAKLIVVCSRSGRTARMVSRFRCPKPIIGMTTDEKVWRKLALSWAVIPAMSEEFQSADVLFYHAVAIAKKSGLVDPGDVIVITGGQVNGKSGNTSLVKFETIK